MTTLKETAKAYEPPQTRNVTELEALSLDVPILLKKGKKKPTTENPQGEEYEYSVAVVLGEEYRIPDSVLHQIKTIMESKPTLKVVKVVKKGTGLNTTYTTIPLE